jgi:hypothetical protein
MHKTNFNTSRLPFPIPAILEWYYPGTRAFHSLSEVVYLPLMGEY